MAITQRRMTLEEFLELPEEKPALEYVDGEVVRKVSPQGEHSTLETLLPEWINRFARPRRLAHAFAELRISFGGWSPVPDIAVYRWSRIPFTERGRVPNTFPEPPDIAIEIVSPDQSVTALAKRCQWFVEHGVGLALLIDPGEESVIIFRPESGARVLAGTDEIDFGDTLPGFRPTVQELFALLSPSPDQFADL